VRFVNGVKRREHSLKKSVKEESKSRREVSSFNTELSFELTDKEVADLKRTYCAEEEEEREREEEMFKQLVLQEIEQRKSLNSEIKGMDLGQQIAYLSTKAKTIKERYSQEHSTTMEAIKENMDQLDTYLMENDRLICQVEAAEVHEEKRRQ